MLRSLLRRLRKDPPAKGAAAPPPRRVTRPARPLPSGVPAPDQDRDLLLYGYSSCPYCRKVYRRLDALGLDVPRANTRKDREAANALRSLTGKNQVPCLVIDGQPLLESDDINVWLEAYAARG